MKELNSIISTNLIYLRKKSNLTQASLAEKLNYTDKAISKWETGETLPDVETLFNVAALYGVTLDYLTTEHSLEDLKAEVQESSNKIVITLLSTSIIWIIATIIFVYAKIQVNTSYWIVFIWAVPISIIVLIIFNSIWGSRCFSFILVSAFTWALLASFFLQFIDNNIWPLFLIGVPFQIAIILWSQLKHHKKKDS